MDFGAIVAPTIGDLFEQRIQQYILEGKLKIGEKLPTEQELADSMRISKSAVHIGIKNLERQGFLKIAPRHGTYVANYHESGNIDTLVALLRYRGNTLDKKTVKSILQFREGNEGMAMKLLAQKHTDEDIAALEKYIHQISLTAPGDTDILSRLLFEYHLCIGIRSGNNVIPMVMNAFHDISIIFWNSWLEKMNVTEVVNFLKQYTACIASGDSHAALALYRRYADDFLNALD